MTETINVPNQFQDETLDFIFELSKNAPEQSVDLNDDEKLVLLRRVYEGLGEKEHISKRIIRYLMALEWETTLSKDEPVTWEIGEIAKKFCENYGLLDELVICLNQAQITFSNLQSLIAEYDCFHADDYEEDGHIVIRVAVSSDQDNAFKEYDIYNNWMAENITDEGLEHFVVVVRRIG